MLSAHFDYVSGRERKRLTEIRSVSFEAVPKGEGDYISGRERKCVTEIRSVSLEAVSKGEGDYISGRERKAPPLSLHNYCKVVISILERISKIKEKIAWKQAIFFHFNCKFWKGSIAFMINM